MYIYIVLDFFGHQKKPAKSPFSFWPVLRAVQRPQLQQPTREALGLETAVASRKSDEGGFS